MRLEFEERGRIVDAPQHVVQWRQSGQCLAPFGRELLQVRFGDFQVCGGVLLQRRIHGRIVKMREPQRPVKREEDFEKKLTTFLKASDEKIADLNNKTKDPRASKKRAPKK